MANVGNVVWWSVVLIGLLLAGLVAAMQIKKRLMDSGDATGSGFTLGDLRALHRAGKMTDAEFEKAKQALLILATLPPPQKQEKSPVAGPQAKRPQP